MTAPPQVRVRIRPFRRSDSVELFEAVRESIDELAPFEPWVHSGFRRDDAANYVNRWCDAWLERTAFYFVIEDDEGFAGACGLSDLSWDHYRASLGFWVRTSKTGRGIGTAAARQVLHFATADLKLDRVEMEIAVHNERSRAIAEALGARLEGIMYHRLMLPSGPTDSAMYCATGASGD